MARGEKKSAVERLKNRLYDRGTVGKEIKEERSVLSPSDADAPRAWADAEPITPPEAPYVPPPVAPAHVPMAPGVAEAEIIPDAPIEPPKKLHLHMSFATKFFLGSMLFFLVALGVSALLFFGGVNTTSPQNIDIDIVAPSLIDSGKQADLQIIITNRNTTALELADLVIDYPEGARSPNDPTRTLTHDRISIGTINSGQQIKRTLSAIFLRR
jgi:hypothetical protein